MTSYKDTFQDRIGRAADAKKAAIEKLRSKPAPDEEVVAQRQAARLKRDAAQAEKAVLRKAAEQEAKAAEATAAAAKAAAPAPPTEAEQKASRDARYAARKKRR